jgi:hypothetical protein
MAYVVAAVIVVLLVVGFVVFMVTNAASKSDSGSDEGPPGIGTDETPLGDTSEHSDERSDPATLVGRHETDDPDEAAHRARPGEAEGEERIRFEPEQPASDGLGDPDR